MLLRSELLRCGWKMILTNFHRLSVKGEETVMSQVRVLSLGEAYVTFYLETAQIWRGGGMAYRLDDQLSGQEKDPDALIGNR